MLVVMANKQVSEQNMELFYRVSVFLSNDHACVAMSLHSSILSLYFVSQEEIPLQDENEKEEK